MVPPAISSVNGLRPRPLSGQWSLRSPYPAFGREYTTTAFHQHMWSIPFRMLGQGFHKINTTNKIPLKSLFIAPKVQQHLKGQRSWRSFTLVHLGFTLNLMCVNDANEIVESHRSTKFDGWLTLALCFPLLSLIKHWGNQLLLKDKLQLLFKS